MRQAFTASAVQFYTRFIHPISCRVILMTHVLTLVYLHLHLRVKFPPVFSDEGPPCTCPLCASDWSSCVPHSEGLQLSRDLGATYLELPSLNHVFVGRYFGSVVSGRVTPDYSLRTFTSSCEWAHILISMWSGCAERVVLNAGVPLIELHVCVLMHWLHSSCLLNSMNSPLQISTVLSRGGKDR